MGRDIYTELLDHPNPAAILRRVEHDLAQERISRDKFREWLSADVKAEFINGEVIVHSPALRRHNQAVRFISYLLDTYCVKHSAGEVAIEKALVALERNDLEPDVCFWRKETAALFNDELMYYPAPDLVVEVLSKSTKARDRGVKFRSYEEAGTQEYWLVDPKLYTVDQYSLIKNKSDQLVFKLTAKLAINETLTSTLLSGLVLPVKAFFDLEVRQRAITHIVEGTDAK